MKKIITSNKAPAAIGPYSQAVQAGNFLFVSGQLPIDVLIGAFPSNDVEEQTRQSLKNIGAILSEAGYTFDDVVKTTVYLSDINDFSAMNGVYAEFFKNDCPARAAFAVKALPKGAKVEIEVAAYR